MMVSLTNIDILFVLSKSRKISKNIENYKLGLKSLQLTLVLVDSSTNTSKVVTVDRV